VIGSRWHFRRCGRRKVVRVGFRPGEAGVKLIPDQSQRAGERHILEGLGFIAYLAERHKREINETCYGQFNRKCLLYLF
jgi:hypothetical protein